MKDFCKKYKSELICIAVCIAVWAILFIATQFYKPKAAEVDYKEYRCGDVVVKVADAFLDSNVPVILVFKDFNQNAWWICKGANYTLTEWSGNQGPYSVYISSSTSVTSAASTITDRVFDEYSITSSYPSNGRVSASEVYVIKGKDRGTDAYSIEHSSDAIGTNSYNSLIPWPIVIFENDNIARKPISFSVLNDPQNLYKVKIDISVRGFLDEDIFEYDEALEDVGSGQFTTDNETDRDFLSIIKPSYLKPSRVESFTYEHNSTTKVILPIFTGESSYYTQSYFRTQTWVGSRASRLEYINTRFAKIALTFVDEYGNYGATVNYVYDYSGHLLANGGISTPTQSVNLEQAYQDTIEELNQKVQEMAQTITDLQFGSDEVASVGGDSDGSVLGTFKNILSTVTGIFAAMPQFFALLSTLLSFLPQPIMYLIYFGLLCVVVASIYHAIRG